MQKRDKNSRYFKIAGITVQVESDLDLNLIRFGRNLEMFSVDQPGDDQVKLDHYFEWPDLESADLGDVLYQKAPWSVSRKDDRWYYRTFPVDNREYAWHKVAMFNHDHSHGIIFSPPSKVEDINKYGWESLSLFITDQIWLVPVLADRNAVLLHSAAVILNGKGLLFVGHSDAGKSTTVLMLKQAQSRLSIPCEILCDDRNVVRRWEEEWRVYGTWSHGTVPEVSPNSAPLYAILFLERDSCNKIVTLTDRKQIWKRLLATLIKAMVSVEWWEKELDVLEKIVNEVPCYIMHFDKSGAIVDELVNL